MVELLFVPFGLLSHDQLYDALALRERVFTLEQRCTEKDFDGLDKKAVHLLGIVNSEIILVARILPPNVYKPHVVSFGRLAIDKSYRGYGYGRKAMAAILEYIKKEYPKYPIVFSAQLYLKEFYESFGFHTVGSPYNEAGIPHIKMSDE